MRLPKLSAAFAAALFTLPVAAQQMRGMAFSGECHTTTLAMFASDFSVGHMAVLAHGQPDWKDSYSIDGLMKKYAGTTQRLGKNWWTTLMTSTTLELGGKKLPAGSYCVAAHIGEDGKLSLAMIEAGKAMTQSLMPFFPNTWKPDFVVPLELHKDKAKDVVKKMTMQFAADQDTAGKGTLSISWGKHVLTAPAMLHMPKKQ